MTAQTRTLDPIEIEFATRLRALRALNGLTVRDLAERIGAPSPSLIYKYEARACGQTLRNASEMAQGLGYTLVEFLTACLRCGDRPVPDQTCPLCGMA